MRVDDQAELEGRAIAKALHNARPSTGSSSVHRVDTDKKARKTRHKSQLELSFRTVSGRGLNDSASPGLIAYLNECTREARELRSTDCEDSGSDMQT